MPYYGEEYELLKPFRTERRIKKHIPFLFGVERMNGLKLESAFQAKLIKKIKTMFPGCVVLKNDGSNVPAGFPDLTILFPNGGWAELECKRETKSTRRPLQGYYVERLNGMGYSRFVYPENEEEILRELQQAFGHRR